MADPIVTLEHITPKIAQDLLDEFNKGNRRFDKYHALNLAYEMKNDTWIQTADTRVKITTKGKMIDGQHTLSAIVLSQKSYWLFVARNVDPRAFVYIDIGKKRSTADILGIEQFKYPTILAPTVRNILSYNQRKGVGRRRAKEEYRHSISNATVLSFCDQNKLDIEETCGYCYSLKKDIPHLPVSGLAFLYWVFQKKSKSMVEEFFTAWATGKFMSGEKLPNEHPIYRLRHSLITDTVRRYKYRDRLALAIYAWNFVRNGDKKIKNIPFNDDYDFPRAE